MKLEYQERTGLEHRGIAPISHEVRATIPAIQALLSAGATIEQIGTFVCPIYRVQLGEVMPDGIVAAVNFSGPPHVDCCLRLESEPEFPVEVRNYWRQVDFTPCPVCGAPVVWYEAGYVPGYRVCTREPHHHCLARS